MKGTSPEAKQINEYIQQTQSKLIAIYNEMLKDGDINLDNLIERFYGRDVSPMTLMELVKHHNADIQKRIGVDYTFSTFEKYDILRKKLESFIPFRYSKQDIRLKDLTHDFAAEFDYYLRKNDGNSHNTVAKYLKNLKRILNVAVTSKWIKQNPFDEIKAVYKDVERVYLSLAELKTIEAKSFRLERLNIVKDLFLFQCYTGLAYSDMAKLTEADITNGIDGNKWIIIRRKKTDVRSVIPPLQQSLAIIDRYKDNDSGRLLPCYAIQKFNAYLHEIAELCEINKNLTSHVGRRTFATTIALANGVSIETIAKILGHTSTKITHQYAVVTDLKVSEEMKKIKELL
jgi:integrase